MPATNVLKLLFICRHNTVRSQIAEALANKLGKGKVYAMSAGPEPTAIPDYIQNWVDTLTDNKQVLHCNSLENMADQTFDLVITLCDTSHNALPILPGDTQHICWNFHHADNMDDIKHIEVEIAERLRLMFLAKHLL
jgi:protein-tyrosine-phosphatase